MVRLSNGVLAFFNILILLLSIATIAFSAWFYTSHGSACQKVLQQPLLILGASLFVVSILGLVGSCCRIQIAMWIYLVAMFVLILGLMCFTVFTFAVTNRGVGNVVSGRGYKEYRLGDYSNWLQNYVVNEKHWGEIKSCLVDAQFCARLGGNHVETVADFNKRSLTPTQSGCCKPPTYCGFEFRNATFWAVPTTGPAVPDSDCTTWSNNQKAQCYDCKSCKAGILANIKKEWRLLVIINACLLIFITLVYSIGCCALRNNKSSGYRKYRGRP